MTFPKDADFAMYPDFAARLKIATKKPHRLQASTKNSHGIDLK